MEIIVEIVHKNTWYVKNMVSEGEEEPTKINK